MRKIIEKRNYIILFIIIVLILFLIVSANKIKEQTKTFYYFSENITVRIYDNKNNDKLFKQIDDVYKKYNDYYKKPNNRTDKDLIEMLEYGKSLYEKSDKLIDITSGELLDKIDDDFKFESTINSLNFNDKKTLNHLNIDMLVGSYATSKVVDLLKNKKYLINEDGNIIAGNRYSKDKYKISIHDLDGNILDIVQIENKAIGVKGNTTTFKPYMVNPVTSHKNSENKIIVVVANDINEANFLANTLYLKSVKEGKEFIKKYKAEAFWYYDNMKEMTKGFKKYLIEN